MSSARVRQKRPFGPARPNAVRTPSTKTTSRSSRPTRESLVVHSRAVAHARIRNVSGKRHLAREQERYRDGEARLPDAEDADARQRQLTRLGNAAGGAGLALLMQGQHGRGGRVAPPRGRALPRELRATRRPAAGAGRSARSRRSSSPATGDGAEDAARWALEAGAADAESPIGRYAAALAELVLGPARRTHASTLTGFARTTTSRPTSATRSPSSPRATSSATSWRSRRCSSRSRRATSTSRTCRSPTRCSSFRRSPRARARGGAQLSASSAARRVGGWNTAVITSGSTPSSSSSRTCSTSSVRSSRARSGVRRAVT